MAQPPPTDAGHPLELLRARLGRLHLHAGKPSTREIARRIGGKAISHTTVHVVLRCPRIPAWGNLELVVEALGGEVEEFRKLWIAAQDAAQEVRTAHLFDAIQNALNTSHRATVYESTVRPRPVDISDYARSRAILIGVSEYSDATFSPLPAAANSLAGMREVLTDPDLCGWPAERVTIFSNPSDSRRLVPDLRRLTRDTEDVLFVYFVGHGTILPRGGLCLALHDTSAADPDVTGLEYQRVRESLMDTPARLKMAILDCCYSGRAIETMASSEIADNIATRGVYTLAASDYVAHVPPLEQQFNACTSFTGELLDLVRGGLPDGPERISFELIYPHLRQRLAQRGLPMPSQRGTDTASGFPFSRNPAHTIESPSLLATDETIAQNTQPVPDIHAPGSQNGETCRDCGALIGDLLRHQAWHRRVGN